MRRTIKLKAGDPVPDGAKYLTSCTEIEYGTPRYEWRQTPGIRGIIPIFAMETQYRITPRYEVTYLIYEVEVQP